MGENIIIENYNIHDVVKFQLVNENIRGIFHNFNPEYEYFKVNENLKLDFRITLTNKITESNRIDKKYTFRKNYKKWEIEIVEYKNSFIDIKIVPHLKGIYKVISYSALKSLYIRSLIYYCLIKKGSTLVHSSGININNKAYLFVGRPGVFKTSLLMDFLRNANATFLGEENTILHNGKIYSFPFHIKSLAFRIKHYKNENPQTIFHKLWQVSSLLSKSKIKLPISEPCKLDKVFFIEKNTDFSCVNSTLSSLHGKFVENELEELNIKCNLRLSAGIKDNLFSDFLIENNILSEIKNKLSEIFYNELTNCNIYNITMPNKYTPLLHNKILEIIEK